jgi:hypothetical protein
MELLGVFPGGKLSGEGSPSDQPGSKSRGSDMAVQEQVAPVAGLSVETESAMNARGYVYSPWRFFQVMLAVAWSAFAHPLSSTVIDLDTGRVRQQDREERE